MSENNKIIKKSEQQPTFFADFPLIGSHIYPFPCVINSHIFIPDEERSKLIFS